MILVATTAAILAAFVLVKSRRVPETQVTEILPLPEQASQRDLPAKESQTALAVRGVVEGIDATANDTKNDAPGQRVLLKNARKELAIQTNNSLDGFLYINDVLDQVLIFAELPIEEEVDFEYERTGAVGYRFQETPEGTVAHFLVGLQPFDRDGKEFRLFQMEIEIDADSQPEFYRDAVREGPRIHLTLDYDESGKLGSFALLAERRVALKQSRKSGIDAYVGRFTSGAGYRFDFADHNTISETFGIVNGQYVHGEEFHGISPLIGDLNIDPSKVETLFRQFQKHFDRLRKKRQ